MSHPSSAVHLDLLAVTYITACQSTILSIYIKRSTDCWMNYGEREGISWPWDRETHNTGRLLLDRRILDSQIQSTVERTECRVSLFQRPPFPCSYLWLTFLGFVLLTGGWTALDVCVYLDPESCRSSHSSVSLVIHHLITWALAVGVFSPSRLTLHCGLS